MPGNPVCRGRCDRVTKHAFARGVDCKKHAPEAATGNPQRWAFGLLLRRVSHLSGVGLCRISRMVSASLV